MVVCMKNRHHEEQTPWSYTTRACGLMAKVSSLLDMDTAGGERLMSMKDYWPEKMVATEEYPPNIKLVLENLEPLGVRVVDVELHNHGPMPFGNEEFELILNRHSAFNVDEVARVLMSGGTFFTQQVHGMWAHDLLAAFGVTLQ